MLACCDAMKFQVQGDELLVRSFLEALSESEPVNTVTSCSTKIPSGLLSTNTKFVVSATYYKNTSNIVVRCAAVIMDEAAGALQKLEVAYAKYVRSTGEDVDPLPKLLAKAQATWRLPPQSEYMAKLAKLQAEQADAKLVVEPKLLFPKSLEYQRAVSVIMQTADLELAAFPLWHAKMMQMLREEFGAMDEDEWLMETGPAAATYNMPACVCKGRGPCPHR